MLQRIQTIFLLIVTSSMVTLQFFPIWVKKISEEKSIVLNSLELTKVDGSDISIIPTLYIAILAALVTILSLYSIFSFKNRMKQMKINLVNSILMAAIIGTTVFFMFKGEKLMEVEVQGQLSIGFYCIVSGLLFNSLANRFIKRDEDLVRSADRIR